MKVLFIDTVHPILWERLTASGYDCVAGFDWSRGKILENIADYAGIVIRSRTKVDQAFFAAAQGLRFIARSGAGMENIDLEEAAQRKVICFNSPEGNRDAVAEHATGMLLMLLNNLKRADAEVRELKWLREENRGFELRAKTVGIIGFGNMGAAFAQRLSGFGCKILAYDKYKTGFGNALVQEVSLEELRAHADVISLHTPLTEETKGMINSDFIDQMAQPFIFINTARGRSVVSEDLLAGLESGKVQGACLDVLDFEKPTFEKLDFEEIPVTFQKLLQREDVLFSPHVAGWTQESYVKLSSFLADKIIAEFGNF